MGHEHGHHHGHHHLDQALWLTALFAGVELAGGLYSGSLALLADAGHMVSDVAALALAAIAARIAARPAHKGMSYGYGRARILAAQLNGLGLWFLAGWIIWEAITRLINPPQVNGPVMLAVAAAGFVVNLIVLRWLRHGHDLNTRAAYWHVVGDLLGSAAAMVAGSVILFSGWMLIDPLLSLFVAGLLAWGGWNLVRETTAELMEAVPGHIDMESVREAMCSVDGVADVHHIHIWRMPGGEVAISAHVECVEMSDWPTTLAALQQLLTIMGIPHITLQPEPECCATDPHSCQH